MKKIFLLAILIFIVCVSVGCSINETVPLSEQPSISGGLTQLPQITENNLADETDDVVEIKSKYIMQNTYSEKMQEIISLAKNYIDMDDFIHAFSFISLDNKLFHEYSGGVELTYDELQGFFLNSSLSKDEIDYLVKIFELKESEKNENEVIQPYNCVYFAKADVNNDGIEEIVIGDFDRGSINHSGTTIYVLNENMQYEVLIYLPGYTSYRVVEYNETNYLILVDYGPYFTIVYLNGNIIEAYKTNRDEVKEVSLDDLIHSYYH